MSKLEGRLWPLAPLSLAWSLDLGGLAAMAACAPAGLLSVCSMLVSGSVPLLLRRLRGGPRVKLAKEHFALAAVTAVLYMLYFVLSAYLTAYMGIGALAMIFSLQSLTFLIGLSLVKELYIRTGMILCVGITSVGAVCAIELTVSAGSPALWYLLLFGLLLCWTAYIILTLDLTAAYPADLTAGWQNLAGGLLALPFAILEPPGFSTPGPAAVPLFLAGAILWGMGAPVLLRKLRNSSVISVSIVFSALPICCVLAWRLVNEGAGSWLRALGLTLLCVGVVLAYLDMRGTD